MERAQHDEEIRSNSLATHAPVYYFAANDGVHHDKNQQSTLPQRGLNGDYTLGHDIA